MELIHETGHLSLEVIEIVLDWIRALLDLIDNYHKVLHCTAEAIVSYTQASLTVPFQQNDRIACSNHNLFFRANSHCPPQLCKAISKFLSLFSSGRLHDKST
ncbi:uncharacterized protein LOC112346878 [Selaginella moellendorffii]|uniref:uncharacterized protein LOC112346878 n=1 Tax=Selaginella moellendorffii TaxID=88036 RepID=UPI000D1CE68F|nr:uncharacterized protein LOC112346878 [Selaginella moellendorffii]|eukprot:XP_024532462.1 uncharacterized protein LOC112346878 [Selaginella moellendorffii]